MLIQIQLNKSSFESRSSIVQIFMNVSIAHSVSKRYRIKFQLGAPEEL